MEIYETNLFLFLLQVRKMFFSLKQFFRSFLFSVLTFCRYHHSPSCILITCFILVLVSINIFFSLTHYLAILSPELHCFFFPKCFIANRFSYQNLRPSAIGKKTKAFNATKVSIIICVFVYI